MLSSQCSILSGSRLSGNCWANLLVSPIQRSTGRSSTNPPSLLTFPPLKLPSIFLPLKPGNSNPNSLHSVIGEVSCWFVCKRFDPNSLHKRLRYFFCSHGEISGLTGPDLCYHRSYGVTRR